MSAQQDVPKSVGVFARTGPLQGVKAYTDSFALFVGISDYKNDALPHLPSAENDAGTIRELLVAKYGFNPDPGHTVVLLGPKATREAIERELTRMSDTRRVKPTDRVLIYFSGHGARVILPNGQPAGYLVPYDATIRLDDLSNPSEFQASCVDMEDMVKHLEASPAKHRAVILDACFSGIAMTAKGLGDDIPMDSDTLKRLLDQRGLSIMTAGTSEDEALASTSRTDLSPFTRCIVDSLTKGDIAGKTYTVGELAGEVKTRTIQLTSHRQNPQFEVKDGVGEMILFPAGDSLEHPTPKPSALKMRNARSGAEMLFVPEGRFVMGGNSGNPARQVTLDGFWIDKNLVTVGEFKAYCQDQKIDFARFRTSSSRDWQDDHPMVNVTWAEARAYCKWAGGDLPTEAEWEKAARGTDGRAFPWGDTFDLNCLWCSKNEIGDAGSSAPVGSFPSGASPYGCLDMAGNVNQWCFDWFGTYEGLPNSNPTGHRFGTERVVRGGDWQHMNKAVFQAAGRNKADPDTRNELCGFRMVTPP